ncbi:PREDICTED: uncharacterized protein LOC104595278 isoform X2 [Nelumbo nucifera]|uniref:Uncharacterized protein LOC104595278 isoform X2 n=1 Tax=Nelumbo nucifera TaxID=4432 RepID=A0A1U7ZYI2_NELNU|nr:PREDICTED: uncharacterized protein LOC104595278 isoform X2 [Nelumbo nucifera]
MAVSSTCFLNFSPPITPGSKPPPATPSAPALHPSKSNHISWPTKEGSWRKQCVLAMACIMVSCEMGHLGGDGECCKAKAEDLQQAAVAKAAKRGVVRWSDRRMCPPWRVNSLEIVVPENLPRPSAQRRWESVDLSRVAAPPVKAITIRAANSSNCYTM